LEGGNASQRLSQALGDAGKLGAVVEGKRANLWPSASPGRCPMKMLQPAVQAKRAMWASPLQKMSELGLSGRGGRAAVAGYDDGAASVGEATGFGRRAAPEVTAEKAAHEAVTRAQYVIDLDRKTRHLDAVLDGTGIGGASCGAALQDDEGSAQLAHAPERGLGVGGAAGD